MASGYKVAVVGSSDAVGNELISILEERDFPVSEFRALEPKGSLGDYVQFHGDDVGIEEMKVDSFRGIEIAFFAAGDAISRQYVPLAVQHGCTVIDNSSHFILDKDVPLVVPEVNAHKIKGHSGIIANPSCTTIQLVVALYPIHKAVRIKRIVVSTYQAISDNGKKAMDELTNQIKDLFNFRDPTVQVYPYQIAFNVLPHIDEFLENAYTTQEMKIANETKKILEDDSIGICATTVRIPVFYGHCASINIESERKISPDETRNILRSTPGVQVLDDPSHNIYPLPIYTAGMDDCFVGRIREDISIRNGLVMWVVSDNIRKGAALNAVQIAEHLIAGNE
ncbi:MAG: aspartate-semialdehyde dehydrogenase [Deltaproteobacteria bacterium]|nr:aspartate-semialdehyde dehydrogenase [Deltaproteobacteria bacterium]